MVERRLAKANVAGPNPVSRSTNNNATTRCYYFAPLAQLVEQLTLNQRAQGSSPWRCTKPRIRAHLAPFLRVSGSVTYVNVCARRPRTRKDATCNPSARFG